MSGQFEQRRLARPSYQLDVLDAFVGDEQLRARAELRRRGASSAPRAGATTELAARARPPRRAARRAARARRGHRGARAGRGGRAARGARAAAARDRARRGRDRGREALAPDEGEGAAGARARRRARAAPLEQIAPELAPRPTSCATSSFGCARRRLELRRFLDVARGRARPAGAARGRARADRRREAAVPLRDLRGAARSSGRCARRAGGARGRSRPARSGGGALAAAESALRQARPAAGQGRRGSRGAVREGGRGRAPRDRPRRGRVPRPSCASASRAQAGADAVAFLIRPNPGLPFAPVAETASGGELSRIALAIAAVAGGETMVFDEIDAGIGGETAHAVGETLAAPRRASPGDHDHAPPADREPSQSATSASKRSPATRRTRGSSSWTTTSRQDELRAYARRPGVPANACDDHARTFVEHTGPARLDGERSTSSAGSSPDDIAIIDHADLDRVSAEELIESGVRVVVNVRPSQTGRFPNPGPLDARPRRRRLIDAPGAELFDEVTDGELLTVRAAASTERRRASRPGTRCEADELDEALAEQRRASQRRSSVRREHDALHARGGAAARRRHRLPGPRRRAFATGTRSSSRAARATSATSRIVRPYIRDFRPVLVGVDGGADALLEAGYRPDVMPRRPATRCRRAARRSVVSGGRAGRRARAGCPRTTSRGAARD